MKRHRERRRELPLWRWPHRGRPGPGQTRRTQEKRLLPRLGSGSARRPNGAGAEGNGAPSPRERRRRPAYLRSSSSASLSSSSRSSCLATKLPFGQLLEGSVRRALHIPKGNIKIYVPKTSLSSPPWQEVVLPDPVEEAKHHAEVVQKVNELIATGQYGRLFAVVHFASHQWKVTSEDLILIENELDLACGERIRLEKVLLVGADNFTLLGKPLLGKDLVRVEATVIEKTESWPKINMKFKKRKNFRKKKIIVSPQTVLRINTIELAPCLL